MALEIDSDQLRAREEERRPPRSRLSTESECVDRVPLLALGEQRANRPVSASAGSVEPITFRRWATAFSLRSAIGMHGPEVMNPTSEP